MAKSVKPAKQPGKAKTQPKLKKAEKPAAKAVLGESKKKEAKAPKGHKKARKKVETTFDLLDGLLGKLHKQLRKVWGKTAPDLTVLTADDRATLGLSQADVASLEQLLAVLLHKKGEGFLDAMFNLPGGADDDEGTSSGDGENDGDDLELLGALADDGDE